MKKQKPYMIMRAIDAVIRQSYARLLAIYALVILLCSVAYFLLYLYAPTHAPTLPNGSTVELFLNALYFSVVTATSVGYGDIVPYGLSKVFAAGESFGALFIFTILVCKTVSHRQELALSQVHTLTFNDIFTNVREGFFIIRRDFEAIMEVLRLKGELTPRHWQNLAVAYRHYASLLESIPQFYSGERGLYTIDKRRELLLIDAVERTMNRLLDMLDVFKESHIQWMKHAESENELKLAAQLTNDMLRLWEDASPTDNTEAFERMRKTAARLATA